MSLWCWSMQNKFLLISAILLAITCPPIAFADEIVVVDAGAIWNLTLDDTTDVNRLVGEPGVMVARYADAITYKPLENATEMDRLVGEPDAMVVKYADAFTYQPLENATEVGRLTGEPDMIVVKYADAIWSNLLTNPFNTELTMLETTSSNQTYFETINNQNATINATVLGDFNGTLNFTNIEFIKITSGPFTGQGFSKGSWTANIEGNSYEGQWEGMLFKKPEKRKIYVRGTVSGGLKGIVEGHLMESVNGSGIYDNYQAIWTISKIGTNYVFAKENLNGTVNYHENSEYSSKLYALQTSIEGVASGYYDSSLSVVLTHVRIDDNTNPYNGQGFSIISYTSELGSGKGWTYDKLISHDVIKLNGISTNPVFGIVSGILDESELPRTLNLEIERIDIGEPPKVELKVKLWGPGRASPGQTITRVIEIKNDGLKSGQNITLVYLPSYPTDFVSASSMGIYDDVIHIVRWDYDNIPPKTSILLNVKERIFWGLPQGTLLKSEFYIFQKEDADSILFHHTPSLTDEAKLLLQSFFIGLTSGLGIPPLQEIVEIAAPSGVIGTKIRCNQLIIHDIGNLEYCDEVQAIANAVFNQGHSLKENGWTTTDGKNSFPPGTSYHEVLSGLKQNYEYIPIDDSDSIDKQIKSSTLTIATAHDPNIKYGPEGFVLPGQKLNYTVEFENEGEGIAFGVYFTDHIDEDLDDSTLEIGPVVSIEDSSIISPPGLYNAELKTITWFAGEVGHSEGGYANFSINLRDDAEDGTEIINYATVYFPSVPEETRTNGIVSTVDLTPPSNISRLMYNAGTTWLNWTWTNPLDPDFNHTEIYINGTFITNVCTPQNHYNATGMLPNTSYELSMRTVDTAGNVNETWVNDTARTLFASDNTPPTLSITFPAPNTTTHSPTITITGTAFDTSGIASVIVNGEPATGTTTWSAEVTLTEGENTITVVATDGVGLNTTKMITVWLEPPRGDLNDDGRLTPADAAIALQLAASGGWDANADVSGDGSVTSLDALMILQAAAGAINL